MNQASHVPGPGEALVIVDVQNDFLPGGSLPVPDGDAVLPALNRCLFLFGERKLPIIATRDWHPENHCSFTGQGGVWPPHCVQYSKGASFPHALDLPCEVRIVSKGDAPDRDAYSGFDHTDLHLFLRSLKTNRLVIGGLATDYCIRATVFDARKLGYEVFVLSDAVRAVNVRPGDGDRALAEMAARGARLIVSGQLKP